MNNKMENKMTRTLAIILLLMMSLVACNQTTKPDQESGAAQGTSTGENCEWVCMRWGKKCTIDSRTGKYDCNRSCENFGKVCE
jgi:hypothetical protein